jgi:hypothetical protein
MKTHIKSTQYLRCHFDLLVGLAWTLKKSKQMGKTNLYKNENSFHNNVFVLLAPQCFWGVHPSTAQVFNHFLTHRKSSITLKNILPIQSIHIALHAYLLHIHT